MTISNESYLAVVEALTNGYDADDIVKALIRRYPDIFVEIYHETKPVPEINIRLRAIVEWLVNGQKVDAIKAIRDYYSLGLKESKDVADSLMLYMSARGMAPISIDPACINSIVADTPTYFAYKELLDAIKQIYM